MNLRRPPRLSSILLALVVATVTAVDADGEEEVATADDWGEYALDLPYGAYTLKASASCLTGEVDLELDDCEDRVQDIPVSSECN